MVPMFKKMSRISLIVALTIFSLRPSAVNCQNPIVANPDASVFAQSKTSVLSHVSDSEQHIARRCSFINIENHDILKTVSTHKLVYCLFNRAGLSAKKTVLFSAVLPVFSSGLTPLRI
jgi:hypothetical protein